MSPHLESGHALADDELIDESDERSRMSFLEHLEEFRRRILFSIYAVAGSCALTFYFWNDMYLFLTSYFAANGGHLIYTKPMAGFMFTMKVGFLSGLLIASPFVFAQLWLFVAPGLYAREKKVVVPFVLFSTIFFLSGAAFAHYIAFPSMWRFFASYQMGSVEFFPTIDETFSFYSKVILGLGIVFEMPMLVYFLAKFGIVTAGFMVKQFKYAVLFIFIIAAVITPSADVVTQLVFAAPMLVLYGISIVVAWIFGKKRQPAD